MAGLIDYANTHFELAQEALRDGDFARYGAEIALVQAALQRLEELAPGLVAAERRSVAPAPRREPRGGARSARCSSTLARPATWPLALAAFLIRGGIVLVVLPDRRPADAGRARQRRSARRSSRSRFGSISLGLVVAARRGRAVAVVAWLVARRLAGRGARGRGRPDRRRATRTVAAGRRPVDGGAGRRRRPVAARILAARLIAYVPLVVALAWGTIRIVVVDVCAS